MSTLKTGALRGTSGTADTMTLHASDGSVEIPKLKVGSDAAGDVLYHNGTNYIRLAKGTAGQVLTMNSGATAPEWSDPNGWVKLYTHTISGDTEITDAAMFSATYTQYMIKLINVGTDTDGAALWMQLTFDGDSGTFKSDANYRASSTYNDSGNDNGNINEQNNEIRLLHQDFGNDASEAVEGQVYYHNPAGTGIAKMLWWDVYCKTDDNDSYRSQGVTHYSGTNYTNALKGIKIYSHGGALNSGTLIGYGMK